jgi:hypothetical protein
MKNARFYALLHGRGLTVAGLAAQIHSSRAHVTEVLNNKPGRGGYTRAKLAPLLTPAERDTLGWDECGKLSPVERSKPATPLVDHFLNRKPQPQTCPT